ncbi:hypothetical protein M422DRAFT_160279 [Sphaerobolus stellatus SS14]|nr:hypothetical protein M422DRAFT_160279 [Sphaerobolus stellatus SS14]
MSYATNPRSSEEFNVQDDVELLRRRPRAYLPLDGGYRERSPSRRRRLVNQIFWPNHFNIIFVAKWFIAVVILIVVIFIIFWELHIEIMWYSRNWVQKEIITITPLSGCFNMTNISPKYNITQAMGPKKADIQGGLPMRFGLDCYDFAGTIQPDPDGPAPKERRLFHTYWRVDLAPFGERQEWMLKSFFAMQDMKNSKLVMWSNGDLRIYPVIRNWLEKHPEQFALQVVDLSNLARGTALEGSPLLTSTDEKAWTDGDLIRLLLLWNFGGAWVDMDTLLTRDLSPLMEHEFITQWDCYDKKYQPFNGALMHFFKHSPYLCEFFHLMANTDPPRPGSTDWGSTLYFRLWRRLVANGIPPFKILPFCFSDGRSCRMDNRLPDPFSKDPKTWAHGLSLKGDDSPLKQTLDKVFAVHLHNQWEKNFPEDGWVDRYLLRKYDLTALHRQ